MLFQSYPRDIGPPRRVAHNKEEYYNYINLYNGKKKSIFTSTYKYRKIRKQKREVPDYETVLIDKLFFDFDSKSCTPYIECNKLHQECLRRNLKHSIIFSGRGYHLYIFVNPIKLFYKKNALKLAQESFINSLKIVVDRQVVGNIAQMSRIPNTFNIKGNKFCIPLSKDQFEKGDEHIRDLSTKQNFIKDIFIGEKLFDMKQFDKKSSSSLFLNIQYTNSECKTSIKCKDLPPCIDNIMQNPDMNYKDRYVLIIFFRERGYFIEEVRDLLKKVLSPKKYKHCLYEENQLQYLFNRFDLVFPTCKELQRRKKCIGKCEFKDNIIYK